MFDRILFWACIFVAANNIITSYTNPEVAQWVLFWATVDVLLAFWFHRKLLRAEANKNK